MPSRSPRPERPGTIALVSAAAQRPEAISLDPAAAERPRGHRTSQRRRGGRPTSRDAVARTRAPRLPRVAHVGKPTQRGGKKFPSTHVIRAVPATRSLGDTHLRVWHAWYESCERPGHGVVLSYPPMEASSPTAHAVTAA